MSYLSNAKYSLDASGGAKKDFQFVNGISKSRVTKQLDDKGNPVYVVGLNFLNGVQADVAVSQADVIPMRLRNGEISEDYVNVSLGDAREQHEVTLHTGDKEETVTMTSEDIASAHQEMKQKLREKRIESLAGLSDASDDNQDDDQASGPNV